MADYFRKSIRALCPDGAVRRVQARAHCFDGSLAPDTYFSVPAGMKYRGKYVHGYLSTDSLRDYPAGIRFDFNPHTVCNPWPEKDSDHV